MKNERMVGARLPKSLVTDLEKIERAEQADRSATLRKLLHQAVAQWKLEHHARLYADGALTLARAAQEAGVSLWEMMDYTQRRRIPAQYDLEDLEKDVDTIRKTTR